MNWLWLVIGIMTGGAGHWLLGYFRRQRNGLAERPLAEPSLIEPPTDAAWQSIPRPESAEAEWLWLSYVRALERAQFQGGFLARAAHELRSPLSSLMGLQQLILADLCDDAEEERQCVAQSYEAAQSLHGLMDQLIRVSKLEQGSQRLDIQPIAIDVLLEDVESFVQLQVADRNCRLHLQLPAQSVYAMADYNSLRQVLVMLIEAALSQNASELFLNLSSADSSSVDLRADADEKGGVMLQIRADQPLIPLQEDESQLQADPGAPFAPNQLKQLKQSLAQNPDSKSFVAHRLSSGMVLLVSQLLVDLNGGWLGLSAPGAIAAKRARSSKGDEDSDQGFGLELWLPAIGS